MQKQKILFSKICGDINDSIVHAHSLPGLNINNFLQQCFCSSDIYFTQRRSEYIWWNIEYHMFLKFSFLCTLAIMPFLSKHLFYTRIFLYQTDKHPCTKLNHNEKQLCVSLDIPVWKSSLLQLQLLSVFSLELCNMVFGFHGKYIIIWSLP